MPIYEFYSPDTHTIYQFFARSLSYRDKLPRCPDGDQHRMQKKVSSFAFLKHTDKLPEGDGLHDPEDLYGDPKFSSAVADMERAFASMDPDNPDPKALGKMMRQLAEISGESVPEDMQEMIGRMEAGEDLEAIEERFGDLMDAATSESDAAATDMPKKPIEAAVRLLRRARKPRRAPELYELTDYL